STQCVLLLVYRGSWSTSVRRSSSPVLFALAVTVPKDPERCCSWGIRRCRFALLACDGRTLGLVICSLAGLELMGMVAAVQNSALVISNRYRIGMWVGLASILMLFTALTSAYIVRAASSNDWKPLPMPRILLLST